MQENKIKVIANIPNGYECNNRIYSPNGGGRTLTARDWKDAPKILVRRSENEQTNRLALARE